MSVPIDSLLGADETFAPPPSVADWFGIPDSTKWTSAARNDPDPFWDERATRIDWERRPDRTVDGMLGETRWFPGGRLNATVSCLDRHAARHPDAIAYDYLCENGTERTISYGELLAETNALANALASDGVNCGDRVCIYMPLSIEGIVAMLACARLGAVHSVVYAGLGASALRDRIEDAGAAVVIAADVTYRRGKAIALKAIVDDAVDGLDFVRRVVVWRREATATTLGERERNWIAYVASQSREREATIVDANHPLFILYTSGTTGKPKGTIHVHGGYLVGGSAMFADTTGISPGDRYWCTSDIGWIVGHTLIVYGALANGYRCVIREGAPDYPSPATTYDVIAQLRVSKLYTAPTLARMLMRFGTAPIRERDLSSLQAIFCAGEPLNPEAWHFLHDAVGGGEVAVCNHWWQTETGGPMLGYLPSDPVRPDRSGKPFGPVDFDIVADDGTPLSPGAGGLLVARSPWPHMFAGIWNDPERYRQYFTTVPGCYLTGDVASRDADGTYNVVGRFDDVLNVAGHRIATADVESALVSHPACGEAAAIGVPDALKGEAIKAFVVLRARHESSEGVRDALIAHVRYHLGAIATPAALEIVARLPKTRSGKIMRRLLRAQETGTEIGDVTTLEE